MVSINFKAKAADTLIQLNQSALDRARLLIATGHAVNDKHGQWCDHQPTRAAKSRFIRDHGFGEYAAWHLMIDSSHRADTRARYKFPFGDFTDVHRCALIAVIARARQYQFAEIETAGRELLDLLDRKAGSTHRNRRETSSSHPANIASVPPPCVEATNNRWEETTSSLR
jgi:hypothetical protein